MRRSSRRSRCAVTPEGEIEGARIVTISDTKKDLLQSLGAGRQTINFVGVLLAIVAACIVGSVIYLSALERVRDFAVFKATGTGTPALLGGLAVQAMIVSLVAAAIGALLALVLAPMFPMPAEIPPVAFAVLPVVAVVVGALASLAGLAPSDHRESRARVRRCMMPELEIKDLVVEYSSGGYAVRPIDGLSVTCEPGELVLLLGPSGCGKTTLLSCLGGILTPTEGPITFGDVTVTGLDGAQLTEYRRNTVGIVFQAFNLVPSLTALENVEVPLRAAKVPRAQRRARATELLEQVGLGERMQHRPGDMSGGQQQRVAIARAPRARPAVAPRRRAHRAPRLHRGRGDPAPAARPGVG